MIISHARKFIYFPDPLDIAPSLTRGLMPLGETNLVTIEKDGVDRPFFQGMSPHEAEWSFDALGHAYRSYMRVTLVENPYVRLVRLYEKISTDDPFWVARRQAGLGRRDFTSWLASIQQNGPGAAGKHGPRWRRYAAWSAKAWCGDHISHVVRAEAIEDDLEPVLRILGVAPAFDTGFTRYEKPDQWQQYYTEKATQIVQERYAWDLAQYGYATSMQHVD
jgi:hypothetical protein